MDHADDAGHTDHFAFACVGSRGRRSCPQHASHGNRAHKRDGAAPPHPAADGGGGPSESGAPTTNVIPSRLATTILTAAMLLVGPLASDPLAESPVHAGLFPAAPLLAQELPDTIPLEELVVTATPVPLPPGSLGSHVSVLEGEELRARGIQRVSDALREEAGLTLARNGSYGAVTSLFLRGGESDYVQVLLDGVPLNHPGGAVDLAGLTTEGVERIEIVRGPASALYGSDAVAGVVHIITREGSGGEGTTGSLDVRGGSYGRLDGTLEVRGGGESASYGVSLARHATDGILPFNNRHENRVLKGSARVRLDDRSRARITARLTDRDYHFPTDFSGAVVDTNQWSFSDETTVGVEIGRRLLGAAGAVSPGGTVPEDAAPGDATPGTLDLRALVSLHDQETGTDDAPDGPADTVGFYGYQSLNAVRRASADVRATWTVTESATLVGGGELESQRLRAFSESLSQFGDSNDRSRHTRTNRAGYLHGVLELGPVDLNSGVRLEDNEQYGRFFTWQAGASWNVLGATRLRASAGRGIKEPTFFEAYATGAAIGNPDLDPERSLSWEVGVEQRLGSAVRTSITWFDQAFRDLIQYTFTPPEPGAPNYFNVAAADARGLEWTVEAAVRGLTVTGQWTHLRTEVVDAGFDEGPGATFVEGEPLLRRPENELALTVRGRTAANRIGWNAGVRHVDDRADRDFSAFPAEPVTLEAHTLVSLGLDVRVLGATPGRGAQGTAGTRGTRRDDGGWSGSSGPAVDIFLRAENVTDQAYQEVFGFPAPGRALVAGARVQLGGG